MAEVFAAKLYGSDGFEKDLVIKQILPQYARDPEFVQSFVAEAKIAVSLTHANIVSIYELGRVDGTYFIAMEYIEGEDTFALLDAARRQKDHLDPGLALLIVEEVCRGLDYAHRKSGPDGLPLGLVHRDLNPRNVLIAREGEVKILDFGIAKTGHKSAAMPKTRAGVVKGTTGYMSPEQATGQTIDHRTDIYQAGLLLFECLTGQALFWRPEDQVTRDLMRRHHVPAPSELVPGLPKDVDQIVQTALHIRPRSRYDTASELAAAIGRIRAIHYPYTNARMLGDWVVRLLERNRAATRVLEEEIPETADFSEVISHAIQQSIVGKTPCLPKKRTNEVRSRTRRPQTGSQPLDGHVMTGDVLTSAGPVVRPLLNASPLNHSPPRSRSPSLKRPLHSSSPRLNRRSSINGPLSTSGCPSTNHLYRSGLQSPVPTSFSTVPTGASDHPLSEDLVPTSNYERTLNYLFIVLSMVTVVILVALPWWLESQRLDRTSNKIAVTSPPNLSANTNHTPVDQASYPQLSMSNARITTADFGSWPCQGRVSINNRTLSQLTPIYAYPLKPGDYQITMTSENCPSSDSPRTADSAKRQLTKNFSVRLGMRLKVVADFRVGRIVITHGSIN